jgi:hypothetical protein
MELIETQVQNYKEPSWFSISAFLSQKEIAIIRTEISKFAKLPGHSKRLLSSEVYAHQFKVKLKGALQNQFPVRMKPDKLNNPQREVML